MTDLLLTCGGARDLRCSHRRRQAVPLLLLGCLICARHSQRRSLPGLGAGRWRQRGARGLHNRRLLPKDASSLRRCRVCQRCRACRWSRLARGLRRAESWRACRWNRHARGLRVCQRWRACRWNRLARGLRKRGCLPEDAPSIGGRSGRCRRCAWRCLGVALGDARAPLHGDEVRQDASCERTDTAILRGAVFIGCAGCGWLRRAEGWLAAKWRQAGGLRGPGAGWCAMWRQAGGLRGLGAGQCVKCTGLRGLRRTDNLHGFWERLWWLRRADSLQGWGAGHWHDGERCIVRCVCVLPLARCDWVGVPGVVGAIVPGDRGVPACVAADNACRAVMG